MERDYSLLAPDGITYREIESAVWEQAQDLIKQVWPVDIFRGGSIPAGYHSLLLRITFHSLSHTLTSAEVDAASSGILQSLQAKGVRLRTEAV